MSQAASVHDGWFDHFVPIADIWFTSASFWAPTAVVLVTTAVLVAVAYRTTSPRRRLVCGMTVVRLLNPAARGVRGNLRVTWNDEKLEHPYVVKIKVANRGRRDIPLEAFSGGDPLQLLVGGARIIAPLEWNLEPEGERRPHWQLDGSKLKIHPMLVHRDRVLSFSLLVDGHKPHLHVVEPHPLTDATVRQGNPDLPRPGPKMLKAVFIDQGSRSSAAAALLATGMVAFSVAQVGFILGK